MAERADPGRRASTLTLDDDVFGAPFNGPLVHECVRGRARRAPARHARDARRAAWSAAAAPSRGARRAPAVPAPARRAPRCGPAAAPSSARARATTPSRSTARRAARRCAPRSRCTPSAARCSVVDAGGFDAPSTKQAAGPARRPPRRLACSSCSAPRRPRPRKSFRNLAGVTRARRRERRRRRHRRRRDARRVAGRARRAHARVAANDRSGSRAQPRQAMPDGSQPGDHPPGRLREVLRARDGRQVHVPRPHGRAQDADQAGRRGSCSTSRCSRSAPSAVPSKPKRRGYTAGRTREWKKADRAGPRGRHDPDLPGPGGRSLMPIRKPKPTSPGRRFVTYAGLRGDHEDRAGEVARRGPQEVRRAQRQRPQDRPPPRRRRQAPVPHRSTSSAARTASRPRSPRSSTTPTARPTSRCCTTSTARRRYILAPKPAARRHDRRVRPDGRHHGRQRAAAGQHAGRHGGPQRRAPARAAAASSPAPPAPASS